MKHSIDTFDAKSMKQLVRWVPLGFANEEKADFMKILACSGLRPSNSEWASTSALV